MNEITANVNQLLEGEAGDSIRAIQNAAGHTTISFVIALVLGLAICFLGLRLLSVLMALAGLCIGGAIGGAVAYQFGLHGIAFGAAILAAGIIVAVLACALRKVGVFLWAFVMGAGFSAWLLKPDTLVMAAVCLAIGLVIAIVSVMLIEPLVIIISAAGGGFLAGYAVFGLIGIQNQQLLVYGVGAALAIVGMIVQFMMRSREIGRKEKVHAKAYKQKASMETEVEKARMILEESDVSEEASGEKTADAKEEDDGDDIQILDTDDL